eukprot:5870172-Karenia_brevis.AAC.1
MQTSTDTFISPRLVVLPMGWSWALHLCQSISTEAVLRSGFRSSQLILDKRPAVDASTAVAIGVYVDNFMCIGTSKQSVTHYGNNIHRSFNTVGMDTHEQQDGVKSCEFVGLEFACNQ